jgi:hypothetical protein
MHLRFFKSSIFFTGMAAELGELITMTRGCAVARYALLSDNDHPRHASAIQLFRRRVRSVGAEQPFVRQAKVWGCAMSMLQIRQASHGVIAKPLAREVDQWSGGYWDSGHQASKKSYTSSEDLWNYYPSNEYLPNFFKGLSLLNWVEMGQSTG